MECKRFFAFFCNIQATSLSLESRDHFPILILSSRLLEFPCLIRKKETDSHHAEYLRLALIRNRNAGAKKRRAFAAAFLEVWIIRWVRRSGRILGRCQDPWGRSTRRRFHRQCSAWHPRRWRRWWRSWRSYPLRFRS